MDLIIAVEKIVSKAVSEEEAVDFALSRFGELYTFIRSEVCRNMKYELEVKAQEHSQRLLEDYHSWLKTKADKNFVPAKDVDILY